MQLFTKAWINKNIERKRGKNPRRCSLHYIAQTKNKRKANKKKPYTHLYTKEI